MQQYQGKHKYDRVRCELSIPCRYEMGFAEKTASWLDNGDERRDF